MPKPGAVPRQRAPQGRAAWNRAGQTNFRRTEGWREPPASFISGSQESGSRSFAWRTQRPSRTEVPSALRRNSRTLAPAAFSEELPRSRALRAGRFRAHRAGAPLDIVRLKRRRRPRPGCPKQSDRRRRRRLEPDFVLSGALLWGAPLRHGHLALAPHSTSRRTKLAPSCNSVRVCACVWPNHALARLKLSVKVAGASRPNGVGPRERYAEGPRADESVFFELAITFSWPSSPEYGFA